jgi:hypothetical protein
MTKTPETLEVWVNSLGYEVCVQAAVPARHIVNAVAASAWRMSGGEVTVRTPDDHRIVAHLKLVWEES